MAIVHRLDYVEGIGPSFHVTLTPRSKVKKRVFVMVFHRLQFSMNIVYVLVKSVDPDEMSHSVPFYLSSFQAILYSYFCIVKPKIVCN